MDVAFVTPNLLIGGVEQWLLGLVKYSDPARVRWHVAATDPAAQEPVTVDRLTQYAPIATGQRAIQRLASRMDAVVVWGLEQPRHWIGDFAGPVVVVSHGCGRWTEAWLRSAKLQATHFAAVSAVAAQSFEAPGVHVIENGIDLDRCRALVPREVTRAVWGLRPDEIAVGYVGRLSPEKNCTAVGDAVAVMGAPYRAVFVGPSYDPAYARQVHAAASGGIFVPPVEHVGDARPTHSSIPWRC